MVTIDPKDLIGRKFLMDSEEDGQCFQAPVVCAVVDIVEKLKQSVRIHKVYFRGSKLYC
jgi:hypothetical protein